MNIPATGNKLSFLSDAAPWRKLALAELQTLPENKEARLTRSGCRVPTYLPISAWSFWDPGRWPLPSSQNCAGKHSSHGSSAFFSAMALKQVPTFNKHIYTHTLSHSLSHSLSLSLSSVACADCIRIMQNDAVYVTCMLLLRPVWFLSCTLQICKCTKTCMCRRNRVHLETLTS